MKKLFDVMLLIFCIGTLINGSDLIIENLNFLLFACMWFLLLIITLFLIYTSSIFQKKNKY